MNTLLKKNSFEPSQITTGSYLQTVNSYNVSESNVCSFDYLGYLIQTHCPQNNVTKMMTAIDYLTVVFPVISVEALKEIKGWLGVWLRSVGISISTTKPTLKHHEHGALLFPLDETTKTCGSLKWDINKQSCQLEVSGYGCRYILSSGSGNVEPEYIKSYNQPVVSPTFNEYLKSVADGTNQSIDPSAAHYVPADMVQPTQIAINSISLNQPFVDPVLQTVVNPTISTQGAATVAHAPTGAADSPINITGDIT
jgi:hypothetical protein